MRSKSRTSLCMRSISAEWMIRPSKTRELVAGFLLVIAVGPAPDGATDLRAQHARQVSAIDPPAAGRTADAMLGLVRDRLADALAPVSSARYVGAGQAFIAPISSRASLNQGPVNLPAQRGIGLVEQQNWFKEKPHRSVLNFIGAMSGPVTMKSPLTTRMVSVVIAPPYPNDRTKAEARDRAFRLRRTR